MRRSFDPGAPACGSDKTIASVATGVRQQATLTVAFSFGGFEPGCHVLHSQPRTQLAV
jgi:hypothetical protein